MSSRSLNNRSHYQPIGYPTQQILLINSDEDEKCNIKGYTTSNLRSFVYHSFSLIFLCIPYVLSSWFIRIKILKYKTTNLKDASLILIEDDHGNSDLINVKTTIVKLPNRENSTNLRYFLYKHTKFIWCNNDNEFKIFNEILPKFESSLNNFNGLTNEEYEDLKDFYGLNRIEIKIKSYFQLFIEEIFNPFYIFQLFSIILWCFDDYMLYAGCVLILTLFSAITALIETRKQSVAVHNLVESSKCDKVEVLRSNYRQMIDAIYLVPGDLIILPKANFILPCDVVLLTGQCIVNESVLTGESVPVTKTSLPTNDEIYSPILHKRHTLYAGTLMIQSRYYDGELVCGRVVNTGFNTTRGALIKSILYPSPVGLKFYQDSLKFVFVLFIIATFGMSYCFYIYLVREAELEEIVLRTLDIVTIVVPPALPAAMTVGIVYSQNRLKKLQIFCTSPPKINVCGKIKLACFDKTGTLTYDGLDIHSIIPCKNQEFLYPIIDYELLDKHDYMVQCMATCHSLTRIDGELTGDPLDLCMFEFTNWELEEPGSDENTRFDMLAPTVVRPVNDQNTSDSQLPYEIGIVRQFPFSSNVQCMSVICRQLGSNQMVAFTKGAPEKLLSMCRPETVPVNFPNKLQQYTRNGYRVIALGYKELPKKFKWKEAQRTKRDIIECDLNFLGFLIMQNPLKPETTPIINKLQHANIRTIMITGDNILTAISVARDCEMVKIYEKILILNLHDDDYDNSVDNGNGNNSGSLPKIHIEKFEENYENSNNYHYAIDGRTWKNLRLFYPDLIPKLLVKTTIFARFQPDQKTQLVNSLQKLDYIVSMVGDGANDCGALKAAHVGVSLSQAEASVAAPFTSKIPNISCLLYLILEGRCALVTSFAVFKYMALYSLIQFFTILLLYKHHSILGDVQFLFIDLIITTSLAVTIAYQGPYHILVRKNPPGSLVSINVILPLLLQIFCCAFIQFGALFYLFEQKWFTPIPDHVKDEVVLSWENTVLFLISSYQYIILALVYSKGKPFRQNLTANFWFLSSCLILTIFLTYLLIYPSKEIARFFEIIYLSPYNLSLHEEIHFRYKLLIFPILHLIIAYVIEVGIGDQVWLKKFVRFVKRKKRPKSQYKQLLREINDDFIFI